MHEIERHKKITDYIITHQGCLTEELFKAVEGYMARSTFFKYLAKLKKDKVVREEHTNKRDHKLFVDFDNPSILIPQRLEKIETIFRKLLDKSEIHWQNIKKGQTDAFFELNVDLLDELFKGPKSLVYFVPTMILRMITDSVTVHARTIWINKFADRDALSKLFTNVFMKLASLNIDYVKYLNNIHHSHPERVQFDDEAITRNLSPLQLMYASRKIYKSIGMDEEIEHMLGLLWKFNEDIQKFLFPEIEHYKWEFNYDVDDWRKLLEIYEKNPDQTAHNIVWGKKAI